MQSPFRKIAAMTGAVAGFIALAPPALYFTIDYRYQLATMRAEAVINARVVSDLVNRNPDLWQFEQLRLEELLRAQAADGERAEDREIFDLEKKSLGKVATHLALPHVQASAPVFKAGRHVGLLTISRSVRPLLTLTLFIGLFSILVGITVFYLVTTLPLRALKNAFHRIDEEKIRAQVTLQSIGDAVVTTDAAMRVESMNPIAESMIGWTIDEARGRHMDSVFHIVRDGTRERAVNPVTECLEKNAIVEMENHTILIRRNDCAEFHIEDSAAPIRLASGEVIGAVMVFHDVTDRKQTQELLKYTAHHDALTDLPNRALFSQTLCKSFDQAQAAGSSLGVFFLDIDRFKVINDSLGHGIGDQLLIMVARRLRQSVRAGDMVARIGGDEFTAIVTDVDVDKACIVAEKMIAAFAAPFSVSGHSLQITTSIGVALYPGDGNTVELLIQNADIAMYQAKGSGRNTYRIYNEVAGNGVVARHQFESLLNLALEQKEFYLEYQPKLDLHSNCVVGMEALVRWNSPVLGKVAPDQFIPILEDSGKIVPVGEWILRTALTQAKQWQNLGLDLTIAVNFSSRQFQDDGIIDVIQNALAVSELPASKLEIEITESLLMQVAGHNESRLQKIRALGVTIALDDFGTGYSSLGYLQQFPIDVLKIDKSFIDLLEANQSSEEIVKTIISLGHALKMVVVAEGIENAAQSDMLQKSGCDLIQGYWISKPIGADNVCSWLESYQKAGAQLATVN